MFEHTTGVNPITLMMLVQLVTLHMRARRQTLDGLVGLLEIIVHGMSVSDVEFMYWL